MKKSLAHLALLAALLPLPALAAPADSGSFNYSGAYGGVGLGFSSTTDTAETGGTSIDLGRTGFGYGAFLGYGQQIQGPWYVGGELGFGNVTGSTKASAGGVTVKDSEDYTFNADVRAGRILDQTTLVYGKLGWAHSEFNQDITSGSSGSSNDTAFDGIRFGAGAEMPLGYNLTGRLEGVYTDYGSETVSNTKYSPDDVAVRFGVAYYFY